MSDLNKVMLIGRMGCDPELKKMGAKQISVATFRLATTERFRNRQTNQKDHRTEWHNIIAWGALADICVEYLKKGYLVYIEGKGETIKWRDENTNRWCFKHRIQAFRIETLARPQGDGKADDDYPTDGESDLGHGPSGEGVPF